MTSMTLCMHESNVMGRYSPLRPGLGIGTTVELFQAAGIFPVAQERLNRFSRAVLMDSGEDLRRR